jgi:hypothetical protein
MTNVVYIQKESVQSCPEKTLYLANRARTQKRSFFKNLLKSYGWLIHFYKILDIVYSTLFIFQKYYTKCSILVLKKIRSRNRINIC